MPTILRIDAPAHIRRYSGMVVKSGWAWLTGLCMIPLGGGTLALIIMMVSGQGWGAVVCEVWIALWVWAMVWSLRTRNRIRRWLQPYRIGGWAIEDAHSAYWELSPETRSAYGMPLIESMYRLSVVEVRGDKASSRIARAMERRTAALKALVDAEDKLRLYVAEPTLTDNDDLNAVAAFEQAIADIETALISDELPR